MEQISIEKPVEVSISITEKDDNAPFITAVKIIEDIIKPENINYGGGFFDASKGYFIKDEITVFLQYSSWFGTELYIDKNNSEADVAKVKEWVDIILKRL